MLTKRQKQAIATKHKIIVFAMELLKTKNYDQVTIKEICDSASVSVGAFYHHFQSKDDIIDEAFKTFDIELQEFMDTHTIDSCTSAIKLFIEQYLKITNESGSSVISSIFRLQMSSDEKYVIDNNRYFYNKLNQIIKDGIENGEFKSYLNSEDICDWIFRTSRGVIIDWCLHDASYDLVTRGCTDVELVINSLLNIKK
ncbi:MAG: TetR/AcrR family transcriptional regulator [Eubacteriaceae bacterium]